MVYINQLHSHAHEDRCRQFHLQVLSVEFTEDAEARTCISHRHRGVCVQSNAGTMGHNHAQALHAIAWTRQAIHGLPHQTGLNMRCILQSDFVAV